MTDCLVVTGAFKGMPLELVKAADKRGYSVFCSGVKKSDPIPEPLRSLSSVHPVQIDVADPVQVDSFRDHVRDQGMLFRSDVRFLIVAGAEESRADKAYMEAVNVGALRSLLRAFGLPLRRNPGSRLVGRGAPVVSSGHPAYQHTKRQAHRIVTEEANSGIKAFTFIPGLEDIHEPCGERAMMSALLNIVYLSEDMRTRVDSTLSRLDVQRASDMVIEAVLDVFESGKIPNARELRVFSRRYASGLDGVLGAMG